jgi:4-diphosphocytidyl-2-C-methyl-D-erythritol kinase
LMRVNTEAVTVKYRAYAKVNLALAVGDRRADGYHDISTVMVPVTLCDRITVRTEPCVSGCRIRLTCPALPALLAHRNLAYVAASAFITKTGAPHHVSITVDKRVPWGAGLGGGSSDAAAVLVALNRLVPPEKTLSIRDLGSLAASIGADVPFLVGCNSVPRLWEGALCEGIGERVTPVDVPDMWLVIVFPGVGVDTGLAYAKLDEMREETSSLAEERVQAFLDSLAGGDVEEICGRLFNDLEPAAVSLRPEIAHLKRTFCECGALGAQMTGSGSAVFGIAGSESHARDLALRLERALSEVAKGEIIVARTGVDRDAC